MTTQSRLQSLVETTTNTAVGLGISLASQLVVFPLVGIDGVHFAQNLQICFWFTLISIARGYVIRRWFTRRTEGATP